MNRYLLCRKAAKRPYVVRELGIRIYSPEELCYFIYHNLPLIEDGFLEPRLYEFIDQDCGMAGVSRRMRQMSRNAKYPLEALVIFFQEAGYYTEEECGRFHQKLLQQLRNSPLQTYEKKADLLVQMGRCREAVQYYEKICVLGKEQEVSVQNLARIYEKTARLYMRMEAKEKALEYFLAAWNLTKDPILAKRLCFGCFLTGVEVNALVPDFPKSLTAACRREYDAIKLRTVKQIGSGPVATAMTEHFQGRKEELEQYFYEQKQIYRKMMAVE